MPRSASILTALPPSDPEVPQSTPAPAKFQIGTGERARGYWDRWRVEARWRWPPDPTQRGRLQVDIRFAPKLTLEINRPALPCSAYCPGPSWSEAPRILYRDVRCRRVARLFQQPRDRTIGRAIRLGVHELVAVRVQMSRDSALGGFPAELSSMSINSRTVRRRRSLRTAAIISTRLSWPF